MRLTLAFVVAALPCSLAPVASAQTAAASVDSLVQPAQLREDTRIARAALVESQVGRTWFQPASAFDAGFDALERGLVAPITRREYHRRLAPLVAALGHGHVTLGRAVPGIGYRTRLLDSTTRYLPLALRIVDRRAYILADLAPTPQTSRGAELLSVDGVPVAALLDTMQRYLSADGRNTSFKRFQLGSYWRFHELLDLLHGPRSESRIVVRGASRDARGAAPASFVMQHATPRELHTRFESRTGSRIDSFPPAVQFALLDRTTALLTIGSFYEGVLPKEAGSFGAAFERAFRTVRDSGVTDLIIDVRGNEGGNGLYPPLLYSYLSARPFGIEGRTVVAGPSLSWLRYAADASEEVKAFAASPADFLDRAADGAWLLKPQFDSSRAARYVPREGRHAGRVYILTDGGSFSATNGFVGLAAGQRAEAGRMVTFVGEENGGDNEAGRSTGGVQQALVLPHSGERLTLSLTGGVPSIGAAVRRVSLPDVRVQPTGADLADGTDRVLAITRVLIARARARRK